MIFPWLWRILPGGVVLKLGSLLLIVGALTALLFLLVFPNLDRLVTPPPVVEAVQTQHSEESIAVNMERSSNV